MSEVDMLAQGSSPSAPPRPRLLPVGRDVIAVVAAAALLDAAIRTPRVGVAETLLFAAVPLGCVMTGRLRQAQARIMAAAAAMFAAWTTIRTSPWLVPLDLLAAALLATGAAAFAREGDIADASWPRLVWRGLWAGGHVLVALPYAIGLRLTSGRPQVGGPATVRVVRGLALAAPLVLLIGALLASADVVFAHLLRLPVDPGDIGAHAVLLLVGAWVMVGLLAAASKPAPMEGVPHARPLIGATEALIVLGALVGVFSLFAISQLVALSAGGRHVVETAGLTYAEYARSGYLQLLAVATITLSVLVGLRFLADLRTPPARRWFVRLGHASAALTVVIVIVALRRLDLYERAFGLTMLRLYGEVFAWWLATVFLLLAFSLTRRGSLRRWFPLGSVTAGLVALLVLNVVNPEAAVVHRNVDHLARTGRFDVTYLGQLSDDAVPAVITELDRLDPGHRSAVLDVICRAAAREEEAWSFNLARRRAEDDRSRVCAER